MELLETKRPSKEEQKAAMESYNALEAALEQLQSNNPEIEIEESEERIKIPKSALKLLSKILKELSEGRPVSIIPIAAEMTTQAAAELLSCSRPHIVKLLNEGKIPYTKVGKHRRLKYEDVINYKNDKILNQRRLLGEIMNADEEAGLYDT